MSDTLVNRLRGRYEVGPNAEFGIREFDVPAINIEAVNKICSLEAKNKALVEALSSSNCPKPVCDNKTVGHCISSGNCGCDNKQALQDNK